MNKPNILSNDLDQVAKTGERYQDQLNTNELKEQLIKAFTVYKFDENFDTIGEDDLLIDGETDPEIMDRLVRYHDKLPMSEIQEMLKTKRVVSCELKRISKIKQDEWPVAIGGPLIPIDSLDLGDILSENKNGTYKGTISTYLVFRKMQNDSHHLHVTAKQIEIPLEGAMLPSYVVFHKELTGEELHKENIEL